MGNKQPQESTELRTFKATFRQDKYPVNDESDLHEETMKVVKDIEMDSSLSIEDKKTAYQGVIKYSKDMKLLITTKAANGVMIAGIITTVVSILSLIPPIVLFTGGLGLLGIIPGIVLWIVGAVLLGKANNNKQKWNNIINFTNEKIKSLDPAAPVKDEPNIALIFGIIAAVVALLMFIVIGGVVGFAGYKYYQRKKAGQEKK